ncbi:MAG: response regulator, partial [Endomicrobia bacterium]|nr:response regulator [Endomicrobiia bacterium]
MKKVLIVEDDEPIQTFLYDILSTSGFHPITAKNGIEAINYLEKETPDIVILDCEMPKMDGYETLKYIRSTPRTINLPVIFLTVRGEHKDQVKGIELGADDYIVKPFNKDILIAKIKTLLKHREIATSVNPLTKLPGNTVIEQEIKKRLNNNQHFVFFYIDLANFKAYNDYYGFHKGDEV